MIILNEEQESAKELAVDWFDRFRKANAPFRRRKNIFLLGGYAGTGKAQPYDTQIPTPDGMRKLGEISVGDFVFGRNGKPTKVIGVYPQGRKKVYRINFRDKTSTLACAEHLWVTISKKDGKEFIRSTEDMILGGIENAGGYKFKMPLCNQVQFKEVNHSIHPYLLGLLIGDGYILGTPALSIAHIDWDIYMRVGMILSNSGFFIGRSNDQGNVSQFSILSSRSHHNEVKDEIKRLRLNVKSGYRFIPDEYLFDSIDNRWMLLKGLMDSDGSCRANRTGFTTTSRELAKGIAFLVQSLGGTAIVKDQETDMHQSGYYAEINIKTFKCPFFSKRKSAEWMPSYKNPPSRYITSIKEEGETECLCIMVEDEDHCYLTNDFIVTHNTTCAKDIAETLIPSGAIAYIAPTGKAASRLRLRGCAGAQTFHRFAYDYLGANARGKLDEDSFMLRRDPESFCRLIVLDEGSMINMDMIEDLLSFKIPILALGDLGQLNPINGEPFFTHDLCDYNLETIRRNAGKIVEASFHIRNGRRLPLRTYSDIEITDRTVTIEDIVAHCGNDSVMLCSYNNTRNWLNNQARKALGFDNPIVNIGEKLICTFNQHAMGIMNGEQFILLGMRELYEFEKDDIDEESSVHMRMARVLNLTDMIEQDIMLNLLCFDKDESTRRKFQKRIGGVDYGYALTVHKSQGSEWDNVMILEEFMSSTPYEKLMYTAITRAIKHVLLFKRK